MIVKTIYCPEIIHSTNYLYFTSNSLMVWVLDSQSRILRFKNTGWLQADSDFDPSLVNQMNIRKSWNLVTQRKLSPCSGMVKPWFWPHPHYNWGLNLKIRQNFVGPTPTKLKCFYKNFLRKCECISSCYFPISSNLWKNSLRKTSLFVLFGHLLTGLLKYVSPFVTTQHEWVNNFLCFIWNNINEKVGKLV